MSAYAHDHNLTLALPYFNYYTALNACRTFLLTSPQVGGYGKDTVQMTHQKIINCSADFMRELDADLRGP